METRIPINRYITMAEAFEKHGILNNFDLKAATLFYSIARGVKLFPGYWNNGQWYYHEIAFEQFIEFCTQQTAVQFEEEPPVSISDIREIYDNQCPFTAKQIGCLYRIGAIAGKIKKLGGTKTRTLVFVSSYEALKQFYIAMLVTYAEQYKLIPEKRPRYGY